MLLAYETKLGNKNGVMYFSMLNFRYLYHLNNLMILFTFVKGFSRRFC